MQVKDVVLTLFYVFERRIKPRDIKVLKAFELGLKPWNPTLHLLFTFAKSLDLGNEPFRSIFPIALLCKKLRLIATIVEKKLRLLEVIAVGLFITIAIIISSLILFIILIII